MGFIDEILAQPGFSPSQLALGAVMYLAWTAAYVLIIVKGFRDKSYGVPWPSLMLNIVWEAIFSFNLTDARLFAFFVWGNRLWLAFDVVIVFQFLRYGRGEQGERAVQRWFYPLAVVSFAMACAFLYTFTLYFNDVKGVASSMSMNLAMSLMYPFTLARRPEGRGMSYGAAWLKMFGTVAGSVFLYRWWPAQFVNGRLNTHPSVAEPVTYSYMVFLYVSIFLADCVYIALHHRAWALKRGAGRR